jgi:hypothetical protein
MMLCFFVFGLADIPREAIMCQSLMAPSTATTEQLQAALERKLHKFGSVERMPPATRELFLAGAAEMLKRNEAQEKPTD